MKIMELLLLAFSLALSQLAFDYWWHKEPVRVTTTIDFGKEGKNRAAGNMVNGGKQDDLGYLGIKIVDHEISGVYKGSPAEEVGLSVGDSILDIDNRSTCGLKADDLAKQLTGPIGTAVEIIALHEGQQSRYMVVREAPVPDEAKEIEASRTKASAPAVQKQGPSLQDINRMLLHVEGHPITFASGDLVAGGTRTRALDPDQDNLEYWSAQKIGIALGHLDNDDSIDAIVALKFGKQIHLLPIVNKAGYLFQEEDILLSNVDEITQLALENGHVSFKARQISAADGSYCRLSYGSSGLELEKDASDFFKSISLEQIPITINENEVLLPEVPGRICDMTSKNIAFSCGVQANALNKEVIQNILNREKSRLGIDGECFTCGTVQQIALGDFSGRNSQTSQSSQSNQNSQSNQSNQDSRNSQSNQDAAVIVATPRAKGEQLDLMAFGIDRGDVVCYGAVPLGTGGFDTWSQSLKIDSGMIAVKLTVGEKDQAPPANADISWKFKVCRGKLIKCLLGLSEPQSSQRQNMPVSPTPHPAR